MATAAQRLRAMLAGDELIMAPGAADPLGARMIQQADFPAVYMTGFGATASLLGCPDIGLLTQTEMTTQARNIVRAVDIPVIADADTGYGGPANIERTVREYEQAGVAAIHLEDQVSPKRCGQMSGLRLIPMEEMVLRLQCAQESRRGDDLLIVGRTDALPALGVEEAVRRARAYQQTGVDLVFIDAVKRLEDARIVGRALGGPLMISVVEGNETAGLTPRELRELGFILAIYPLSALLSAAHAVRDMLAILRKAGTTASQSGRMLAYDEFTQVVNLKHYRDLDARFGSA